MLPRFLWMPWYEPSPENERQLKHEIPKELPRQVPVGQCVEGADPWAKLLSSASGLEAKSFMSTVGWTDGRSQFLPTGWQQRGSKKNLHAVQYQSQQKEDWKSRGEKIRNLTIRVRSLFSKKLPLIIEWVLPLTSSCPQFAIFAEMIQNTTSVIPAK